jgi:fumarylacetoacetate (FAA) hydrolase family protein
MQQRLIPASTLTVDADHTILVDGMRTSDSVAPWTFGAGAVMRSFARRRAL